MKSPSTHRIYPIKKKNRYCNYLPDHPEISFLHMVYNFFQSLRGRKARSHSNHDVPVTAIYPAPQSLSTCITWIGHASFLIQLGNHNILTDPIFGNSSLFYPRMLPPGILFSNLPRIDYVLLSHNHLDHMEAITLKALKNRNPHTHFLVPQGDKRWFTTRGFDPAIVFEYTWWEAHEGKNEQSTITFTFLPSLHWSQRTLFDRNRSLWGSWMISCAGYPPIYFGGDTAYGPHFSAIGREINPTIALLPIGPCTPEKTMIASHMNVSHALQAFLDLDARHFVPMHWGTFHFGQDMAWEPIERLKSDWTSLDTLNEQRKLHIVAPGRTLLFE